MQRRAFTLVELLTVIAIIAVLAAILFPVFARAKESAKKTQCISNLRQIGTSIGLYMSDYDDVFPFAVDPSDKYRPEIWSQFPDFQRLIPGMPFMHEALQPYLKSAAIFQCPSDSGTEVLDTHLTLEFKTNPAMYRVYKTSYLFRTEIAFRAFAQTMFQVPSDVNVLFDGAGHWHGGAGAIHLGDDFPTINSKIRVFRYNTLFGDFHVKSLNYDQLNQAWAVRL